ncbi:hypothetical protein CCP2SC5_590002 [Azospirillaceae bacterium]
MTFATPGYQKFNEAVKELIGFQKMYGSAPSDPYHYPSLVERLTAAKGSLPDDYERVVRAPFVAFVNNLGERGFRRMLEQDITRTNLVRCFFDIAHAILQNAEGYAIRATDAYQEVVDDLFSGFVSAEDRRGVKPPDIAVLPPLVKWGEPQFGPYTWSMDATSAFGVGCSIVSLPPTFADRGSIAWSALGHEVAGHDILGADTGLLGEISAGIERGLSQDPTLSAMSLSGRENRRGRFSGHDRASHLCLG